MFFLQAFYYLFRHWFYLALEEFNQFKDEHHINQHIDSAVSQLESIRNKVSQFRDLQMKLSESITKEKLETISE